MRLTPRFKATVDNQNWSGAKLNILDNDKYIDYLKTLSGEVYVTVAKIETKEPRSNQQNRYYWGVVLKLLSEHLGYTPDEIHELLKQQFLSRPLIIKQKLYPIAISTANLTTVEMEEYLTKVREWASIELSCYIPLPNEINY